ncbi:MAG: hypothetical protein WKF58_04865 [Ilumatobacteraceae bacterium]
MTALVLLIGVVTFVVFAVWIMRDEHFADPPRRVTPQRQRQLDEIVEHDEVAP